MKHILIAEKMNYLINYAKNQFNDSKGLHLNSADWKSFITLGTPLYYSFLINGIIKYNTKSSISGKRYEQIIKLSDYKKMEAPLLLLFLLETDEQTIIDYISLFLTVSEAKLYCPCDAFCLEKNTKIDLVDGRVLTIKDIYDEHIDNKINYVYSVDNNNNPTINKINNVWVSGKNNEFIKITLDNNETVITTPEHYYIKRDGSSVMAKDLNINDSLMPIYFNYDKKGYKYAQMNTIIDCNKKSIHRLCSNKYYDENNSNNIVVHHIDFDKTNNNPENLLYMDKKEHLKLHGGHFHDNYDKIFDGYRNWIKFMKENKPDELKELRARGAITTLKLHPEHYKKMNEAGIKWTKENGKTISKNRKLWWERNHKYKEIYSKLLTEKWNDEEFRENAILKLKESWTDERKIKQAEKISNLNSKNNSIINASPQHIMSVKLGKIFKTLDYMIINNIELKEQNYINTNINWKKVFKTFNEVINAYNYYNENRKMNRKEIIDNLLSYNHKITNIEYITKELEEDVYDIEVENDHNFYVNAGVVLHNSYWGSHYNLTELDSIYGPPEIRFPKIRDPKNNNIVCKHLWIVLSNYPKQIHDFAKNMIPYYKRYFGITSPTGIERTKKQLGIKGLKQVVMQGTKDLNKLGNKELLDIYNKLTEGKLNEIYNKEQNEKLKLEEDKRNEQLEKERLEQEKIEQQEKLKQEEMKKQEELERTKLEKEEQQEKERLEQERLEAEKKDYDSVMNKTIYNDKSNVITEIKPSDLEKINI